MRNWRAWTIERKVTLGFVIALGLVVVIGISTWRSLRRVADAAEEVNRAHATRASLSRLLSFVAEAESSQRGFVITGREQYLRRYVEARFALRDERTALRGLLASHQDQQAELRMLAAPLARRMAIIADVIDARRRQGFEAARRRLARGKGERAMAVVRHVIDAMDAREIRLLAMQSARARRTVVASGVMVFTGSALALLIVCGASVAIHRELQSRRRMEETLRQTNVAFEYALDGIARIDANGHYAKTNTAHASILGYAPEDLLGRDFRDLVHPGDLPAVEQAHERMLSEGRAEVECRGLARDGAPVYQQLVMVTAADEAGGYLGFHTFTRDITARRVAEANVRASEAKFRGMMESAPDAMVIVDHQGRLVLVNTQTETLLGYTREELIGRGVEMLVPERFRDQHPAHRATYHGNPTQRPMGGGRVLYARRKDGCELPVEISLSPVMVGDERLVMSAIRDVSSRLRVEDELRHARDLAQAASRAKSDFLARMSHEIRTPMNGIIGMTELALGAELPPFVREHLNLVKASADALLDVINDILDYSKIEAGKLELEETDFDLRELIGNTMRILAYRAHQKGLELAFEVEPTVPSVLIGDPGRLRQIFVNLVGNAIKFTERGEVVVHVGLQDDSGEHVTLRVTTRDTGMGIPPEKQASLFKAFEQGDVSTTRRYGGTGLGLVISSQLVQLMGGRIWVESEPTRGSTFHFTTRHRVAQATDTLTAPGLRNVPVLIVDDNATNRTILEGLVRNFGMRPTAVESGPAALACLETASEGEPFRLLLVDARMPEMDGIELIEHIRAGARAESATIMMLTSDSLPGEIARCQQLGVAAHLTKPIKQSDLFDAIVTALGKTRLVRLRGAPDAPRPVARAARSLRVLLAEDNVINQRLAAALLEQRGHRVRLAEDGRRAVEAVRQESFDVALMDVQMPEMDGLEATRAIRALEEGTGRRIPIVAMTANAMTGDRERCLEAGMDGYVAKPIETARLYAAIECLAAPPEPGKPRSADVLDADGVLARVEGNVELLRELVRLYIDTVATRIAVIRRAALAQDATGLRAAAHALKGASSTLGGVAVAAAALRLEKIADEHRFAEAEDACLSLEAEVARFAPALEGLV